MNMKNNYINSDESLGKNYQYNSLKDRVLRVRKQNSNRRIHECEYCDCQIKLKDSCYYITGINAGQFYGYYVCIKCYVE